MKKLLLLPILFSSLLANSQVFQSGVGVLQQSTTELRAYAAGYKLAYPDSVNKPIFLYASGITKVENPSPVLFFGTTMGNSGGEGTTVSDLADLLAKIHPKENPDNHFYGSVRSVVSVNSKDAPVFVPAGSSFTEQHDINSVTYFTSTGIQYASLTSTANGNPSLALYASSNSFPVNQDGSISIGQKSGESYGIFLDSTGAIFGSNQNNGRLTLGASTVFTTGNIESTGFIKAGTGLVVGDRDLSKFIGSQNTLAYFASSSRESLDVVISNQYWGSSSNAGVGINLSGTVNSLYAYSNNPTKYGLDAGALVIYTQSDKGILFNAVQNNPSIQPEIRIAINSKIIGAFFDGGFESSGLTTGEILAIPDPREGMEIYNRSIHEKCIYNGSEWRVLSSYPLMKI